MAGVSAIKRLKHDYLMLQNNPIPLITAEPLPSNILEWHFVLKGPSMTPYEGGYYHGKMLFPSNYPFKPPSIYMITPNGRFRTNVKICLSISDYHPETWDPTWTVSTILNGLLSFMLESSPTLGSMHTGDQFKASKAAQSSEFNLRNRTFCTLFPDIVKEIESKMQERQSRRRRVRKPDLQ